MKKDQKRVHWNKVYSDLNYQVVSDRDKLAVFLMKHIEMARNGESCFEIGCCPCKYLSYVGLKKGYRINGIDYSEALNGQMIRWLSRLGRGSENKLSVGNIMKANLFEHCREKHDKYDLVYSLGFIEHFKNWQTVLKLHDKYLKPGGKLIITTPNYRGKIRYVLHRIFAYSSLKLHYLPSMKPGEWKKLLEEMGYTIEYCGVFGGFEYQIIDENAPLNHFISPIINPVLRALSINVKADHLLYSPYCGIVARKAEDRA